MSRLFFAYANNATNPLTLLSEEEEEVYQIVLDLEPHGFKIEKESNSTPKILIDRLDKFKENLSLFSYSGHSGGQSLETHHAPAHAKGLSGLLGDCPHLHLVVLNGCSTGGQVHALHDAGIPVVVATHGPANDALAKIFAVSFFTELKNGKTIRQAFKTAKNVVLTHNDQIEFTESRGIKLPAGDQGVWGIFHREEADLEWTLEKGRIASSKKRILHEAWTEGKEGLRVFVIGDSQTLEVYEKIKATLSGEIQKEEIFINDGWGPEKGIHQETYAVEMKAAQVVLILVNDPDFQTFWTSNQWIGTHLLESDQAILYLRLTGGMKTYQDVKTMLLRDHGNFPHLGDLTFQEVQRLKDPDAVYSGMLYPFLKQKFNDVKRNKNIFPKILSDALSEFDLEKQRRAFRDFIGRSERCKLILFQGTPFCGQNLLKNRLLNYLHHLDETARRKPWYISIKNSLGIIDSAPKLWEKIAVELEVADEDPAFIIRLLFNKLKKQAIILILDDLFWPWIDEEGARKSKDLLRQFWQDLNNYFPRDPAADLKEFYLFAISRAADHQGDFHLIDLDGTHPAFTHLKLPTIDLIGQDVLREWHLEHGGKPGLSTPEFRNLLAHCDDILADGHLENVVTHICTKLNCLEALKIIMA